jgi:hypothetical protein
MALPKPKNICTRDVKHDDYEIKTCCCTSVVLYTYNICGPIIKRKVFLDIIS